MYDEHLGAMVREMSTCAHRTMILSQKTCLSAEMLVKSQTLTVGFFLFS
jgi:hypothetical protein